MIERIMLNRIIRYLKQLFDKDSANAEVTQYSTQATTAPPVENRPELLSDDELKESESLFYDLMFGKINTGSTGSEYLENKILQNLHITLQDVDSITQNIAQLPSVIQQIEVELQKINCDTSKIARLIEQDPVFAAKVLKLVNSPLFKTQQQGFVDLQHSITYLGEKIILQLVFTAVMENMANTPKIYFKLFGQQIWEHSLQTAKIAADLARLKNEPQSAAYLIGLIHDIGKIIIFKILVHELKTSHPDLTVCSSLFRQALTEHSNHLSYKIAESWKLPQAVCNALHCQLKKSATLKDPLAEILYQANLYSELYMLMNGGLIDREFAHRLCSYRNIEPQYLDSLNSGLTV